MLVVKKYLDFCDLYAPRYFALRFWEVVERINLSVAQIELYFGAKHWNQMFGHLLDALLIFAPNVAG